MEPQVQASFIPKKPLATAVMPSPSRYGGLVWIISLGIFAFSLLSAGGVFAYTMYLDNALQAGDESLTRAQAAYDPAIIQDLVRLDARMNRSGTLLQKHMAPSSLFVFLENYTLSSVRFTGFDLSINQNGSASLSLMGEALDFASVALQSDAFNNAKALNDVLFSDVNIDPSTGHVVFKVSSIINPALLLYSNTLTAQTSGAQQSTMGAESSQAGTIPAAAAVPVTPAQ